MKNQPINQKQLLTYVVFIFFTSFLAQGQVIFKENWEKGDWWKSWSEKKVPQNTKIVSGGKNGKCMEVTIKKNEHYGTAAKYKFKEKKGYEPEELYVKYDTRYSSNWKGYAGKAPGFDGTYNRAGWGGKKSDGYNGWSARCGANGRENPNGVVPGYYLYWAEMPGKYGKTLKWNTVLKWNTWYCIEQYCKLNTPNKRNGILRAWVNGKLVYEKKDIMFRKTYNLKIWSYLINYYHGGKDKSKNTSHVKLDNLVMSKNRIGCGGSGGGGGGGSQNFVQMVKRNSSGFAIDGGNGGTNNRQLVLWTKNSGNNQKWEEISRGNGFYSYKKKGTNYCIDGGNGGKNNQPVKLYSCSSGNQNQHWKKISAGGGHYRLQKRNASGFSIDGGNGGAKSQKVKLYANNSSNQNQQWKFNTSSAREGEVEEEVADNDILIAFPNPAKDVVTIDVKLQDDSDMILSIIDNSGAEVAVVSSGHVTAGSHQFTWDAEDVANGVFLIKLQTSSFTKTTKLLVDR